MSPTIGETITLDFTTHSAGTGAVTDADSTPTVEVFEDATDAPVLSPTPVKRGSKTGNYRVQVACTSGNGFEAGKSYNVVAAATVGGVTGKGVIGRFQVRTRSVDDTLPAASYTAPPSAAAIRAEIDANSSKLDAAVSSRLATAGYTAPDNAGVAAIKAKTDNLPADPADASDIAASFAAVSSTLSTIAGYLDTEVAAIKAKTDNLPADPADASDIAASFAAVSSTLSTIAGYLDTEVAAIKAKTDNLPADPAAASAVATLATTLAVVQKVLRNKTVTDPATGLMTVYDDDSSTPLLTANVFENVAGSQAYRGQGAERRERLA